MVSRQRNLNFVRGILSAAAWGLVGAIAAVALVSLGTLAYWHLNDTRQFDRQYDINWWRTRALPPIIGVTTLLACAGWAAYAPRGKHRFATTLAILFFLSIPLWFVLGSMELTPRRVKSVEHPPLYPSELLVLVLPPIVVSIALSVLRGHRHTSDTSASETDALESTPTHGAT